MEKLRKADKRTVVHERVQESIKLNAPTAASWYIDGFYYKKGLYGFIFTFIKGEWIRSTKTMDCIIAAVKSYDKMSFSLKAPIDGEIS